MQADTKSHWLQTESKAGTKMRVLVSAASLAVSVRASTSFLNISTEYRGIRKGTSAGETFFLLDFFAVTSRSSESELLVASEVEPRVALLFCKPFFLVAILALAFARAFCVDAMLLLNPN